MRNTYLLRIFMLLSIFVYGGANYLHAENSSNGSKSSHSEELVFDFAKNPELIADLASAHTSWTPANRNITITINTYQVLYHNCLRGTGYLSVRGDNHENSIEDDPGYVRGSMKGTLTKIVLEKRRAETGKVTVKIVDKNGNLHTQSQDISGKGTKTIEIDAANQVENAQSITIAPDHRLDLTKITMVRNVPDADVKDPWLIFKKTNGEAYPIEDDETQPHQAYPGQILLLQSNDIEGFDPVSTMANPYVVTYTVDGNEPQFSNKTDSKGKYWKNGNDNDADGNPIGMHGYVYRRGIVLGDKDSKAGDKITVKVGIFKLPTDENASSTPETVKTLSKTFLLVAPEGNDHRRPMWRVVDQHTTRYDLQFTPDTKQKTDPNNSNKYLKSMTVLDPTESIKVFETNGWNGNTLIAKLSENDKYDLQSLLNAASITPTNHEKYMKSSSLNMRKLSAMQYTPQGIAAETVAEGFYWFIPARKDLYFELSAKVGDTDYTSRFALNIASGSTNNTAEISLKAYYKDDNDSKNYIDLTRLNLTESSISFGDDEMVKLIKSTNEDNYITFSSDNQTAYFTVQGYDNGETNMTVKSKETSDVTVGSDGNVQPAINFTASSATMQISVNGGGNLMPPIIAPYSCEYSKTFDATVKGYKSNVEGETVKTYYLLVNQSTTTGEVMTLAAGEQTGANLNIDFDEFKTAVENYKEGEDPTYSKAGIFEGDQSVAINIPAKVGSNYTLCAAAVILHEDGSIAKKSRIIYSNYTYNTLEAPVLSPGKEGDNNVYPFVGTLDIKAEVTSQNCQIYYKVGNEDLAFDVHEDGTIQTNANLYDETQGITISNTTIIRAIAYNRELGLVSNIVTYRYANKTTDIDEPYFVIDGKTYTSGNKYTQGLSGKQLTIKGRYYDEAGTAHEVGGEQSAINWDTDIYHIYYTTDGTYPTSNSNRYTGPFNLQTNEDTQIFAIVYADGKDASGKEGDKSISEYSLLTLLNSNMIYWETSESNCPNGELLSNQQEIKQHVGTMEKTILSFEFGGSKDAKDKELKWKHYTSAEHGTGEPLNNIGKYTIAPANDTEEDVADVKDEMGNYWNHSKANDRTDNFPTHKATYGLPASGAYVKFEPKKDGKIAIWCCQEGALYYNNNSTQSQRFNEGFLRKRPAYFVDEAGKSYKPTSVTAAGVLSSNWNKDTGTTGSWWNKKGEVVNGIEQKLYTAEQTGLIYKMFANAIGDAQWNSPLQPLIVYLNTEENKKVAGFNVAEEPRDEGDTEANHPYAEDPIIDGTGVCIPSASFMKYTFDVEAGKTYFFFGWMTKIGIRGIGFEPNAEQASETLEIKADKTSSNSFEQGKKYEEATLQRTFKANTWTTLVLPFSVSASEVKNAFGDNTQVLHYRTIQGRTMYFFKHYHQMIVAGTPVLIKPSKEITASNYATFYHVKIDAATVVDEPCNDYGYQNEAADTQYKMIGSYSPQTVLNGNFYISLQTGKVMHLNSKNGSSTLGGTYAYMTGTLADGASSMAKAAYNDLTPSSMDGETTDIDLISRDSESIEMEEGSVYNTNGQLVRQNAKSLNGLAKGVYIVNGKKVVIK